MDELQDMERRGMCGILDESQPKPTRDAFVTNFRNLRQNEGALSSLKQSNSENIEQMNYHVSQINNLKGVLIRQITTKIFKEPHQSYLTKLQEKRDIEGQLLRLTGDSKYHSKIDLNKIDLTFSSLRTDLVL